MSAVKSMKALGIESSCDETAIAIVGEQREILANALVSQIDIHKAFGGVIPEIASRNHLDIIDSLLQKVLADSQTQLQEIDIICATCGPGLMGGLIVGALFAQTLASVLGRPFVPVNHLEAHLLTTRLTDGLEFPFLTFLLSGGHSQILLAKKLGVYEKIGETIDDSAGECFDKVAQMLGLEYPGGPKIEVLARSGDEQRFKFVKPLIDASGKAKDNKNAFNFSFSGLKTAIRREIEKLTGQPYNYQNSHLLLTQQDICDISASLQRTICEILGNRFKNVLGHLEEKGSSVHKLVIAGGVSANKYIKSFMQKISAEANIEVITPPLKLCTDNGVMIAWAGLEKFLSGQYDKCKTLSIKSQWEL
jgi:N6-L-threonylcarbamoyladenine synthase